MWKNYIIEKLESIYFLQCLFFTSFLCGRTISLKSLNLFFFCTVFIFYIIFMWKNYIIEKLESIFCSVYFLHHFYVEELYH